eukprot:5192888-Pleurochrysis_carterae.AAC.1
MDNPEQYTANADQLYSRVTGLYSYSVVWVEIDNDDRKSVVQARVLETGRGTIAFAFSWLGLTQATYRRLTG